MAPYGEIGKKFKQFKNSENEKVFIFGFEAFFCAAAQRLFVNSSESFSVHILSGTFQ